MMYKLDISIKAEKDIQSAYHWYEEQKQGLGISFVSAADKAFASIKTNPLVYGFRRKTIRGCITKRFPYIILFYVKGNTVRIVTVLHTRRKQNK